MFAPANLVHQQQLYGFPQEFDLAVEPQYFFQPGCDVRPSMRRRRYRHRHRHSKDCRSAPSSRSGRRS